MERVSGPRRERRQDPEFHDDRFTVFHSCRRSKSISFRYESIHTLVPIRLFFLELLVVGAEGSWPVVVRIRDLAVGQSVDDCLAELERRIRTVAAGECLLAKVRRRREFFRRLMRPPWFSIALVLIMSALYRATVHETDLSPFLDAPARAGSFVPSLVEGGDYYRIVTAGFLHAGIRHLIENMIALVILGWVVEAAFGRARAAQVFLASSCGGFIGIFALFDEGLHCPVGDSVGASAGVWGFASAAVIVSVCRRTMFPTGFRLWAPLVVATPVIVSLFGVFEDGSLLAEVAHLSGALVGGVWTFGILKAQRIPAPTTGLDRYLAGGMMLIALGAGIVAYLSDRLDGDRPLRTAIQSCLSSAEVSDDVKVTCAFRLATLPGDPASPVTRQELAKAIGILEGPGHGKSPARAQLLAALYHRRGELETAQSIARASWLEDATSPAVTSLMGIYGSVALGRVPTQRTPTLVLRRLEPGISAHVEAPSAPGRRAVSVRLTEPAETDVTIHVIGYRSGYLNALLEFDVARGESEASCDYETDRRGASDLDAMVLLPVWKGSHSWGPRPEEWKCPIARAEIPRWP